MGAWRSIRHRLEAASPTGVPLRFVGRPWRASPSEGYPTAHLLEQDRIVREALVPARGLALEPVALAVRLALGRSAAASFGPWVRVASSTWRRCLGGRRRQISNAVMATPSGLVGRRRGIALIVAVRLSAGPRTCPASRPSARLSARPWRPSAPPSRHAPRRGRARARRVRCGLRRGAGAGGEGARGRAAGARRRGRHGCRRRARRQRGSRVPASESSARGAPERGRAWGPARVRAGRGPGSGRDPDPAPAGESAPAAASAPRGASACAPKRLGVARSETGEFDTRGSGCR